MKRKITLILVVVLVTLITAQCGGAQSGEALTKAKCNTCHALDVVTSAHKPRAEWEASVNRMIGYGLKLDDQELKLVVDYLSENYGEE